MADWPVRGQKSPNFWDDDVKAYIDESVAEALAAASRPVSTDGSFDLPAATGVGFEWVFTADALDGPYMNGVAL